MQQRRRPQRHGQDRRTEIGRRDREHGNADHQQHRDHRMGGADDRPAEREHAPIGRDHASLRQQIDAEQTGDAKGDLGKPVGERRTGIAAQRKLMADGQHLRQHAGRRGVEYRRHQNPQRRLRQCRQPEDQHRARTHGFNVKGYVEHRPPARPAPPLTKPVRPRAGRRCYGPRSGPRAIIVVLRLRRQRGNMAAATSSASTPRSPNAIATGENERR